MRRVSVWWCRQERRGGASREQGLSTPAAGAPRASARLGGCLLACLLLLSVVPAQAAGEGAAASTSPPAAQVEVANLVAIRAMLSQGEMRLRIVTDAPQAPPFTSAILPQPTRLVIDLWNVAVPAKFTPPTFPERAGISKITATELGGPTSITRVVFHLAIDANAIRYQAQPSMEDGSLWISFSQNPANTPPVPAPIPAAAPPTTEDTTAALPITGLAALLAMAPAPAAPAGNKPPPARPPAAVRPVRPRPAAPPPRPAPPVIPSSVSVALATLVGAGAASAAWRWLTVRGRAQGRRVWLRNALRSDDREQWTSALRSVRAWSPSEVRGVDDLLLGVAEDSAHPAAEAARSVLRMAFPLGLLAHRMERGRPADRVRAARVIGLYRGDGAAQLLLHAAESPQEAVAQAAVEALARQLCEDSARPLLAALVAPGARKATREITLKVLQQAGPRCGAALRKALSDPDQAVRCVALEALTIVRPPGSVQAVVHLLSDPAEPARARAAAALGVLGLENDTSGDLLSALSDPSPRVQEQAAMALAQLGGGHLEELLLSLERRACEEAGFTPSARLLEAVATQAKDPLPAFAHALSCFNRGFAQDLARALERAGKLDAWAARMASADPGECQTIASILQAAGRAGVAEPAARGVASPAASVREICARVVGESATAATTGLLRPLLSHADEPVRAVAAEALGRVGGPQDTESLIAALSDPSPMVRAAAAGGLARLLPALRQEPGSAPQTEAEGNATAALVRAARDAQGSVRKAVVQALGAADPEEATHALLDIALRDAEEGVRQAAMGSLGRLAEHQILPILLVEALNSDDAGLRARAVEILAHAGDPLVSHLMIDSLQDEDEGVRAIAGRGLWDVVSPEQCKPLVPFLNSPDPKVRAGVAGTLGKTRSPEWTEVLSAASVDPDPRVRAAIVNALGRIGPEAEHGLPSVLERLGDSDAFVRARAIEAVAAISPESEDSAEQMLQLARDPDDGVRRSVAHCLLQYARVEIDGPLLELLAESDRQAPVLEALAEAEGWVLHRVLSRAQQAPSHIGSRVIRALSGVLRGRWTVADLRPELASLDTESRLAGLEGLAILGSGEAIAEMAQLLVNDPDRRVRLRATQLLSPHLDNLAVFQAMRHAAQADPDPLVREAASEIGRDSLFQSTAMS